MSGTSQEFDSFATRYEEALSQGLGITGEDSAFYAEERVHTLFALLGPERKADQTPSLRRARSQVF
jgi:hypothetical protein